MSRAVVGDGYGVVSVLLDERQNVGERRVGREVGVALDESGLVALDSGDHRGLVLYRLRTVNE